MINSTNKKLKKIWILFFSYYNILLTIHSSESCPHTIIQSYNYIHLFIYLQR